QPDPERRQCRQPAPWPAVGAAHFEIALEAHLREDRRECVGPVRQRRPLAGKCVVAALEEGTERGARDVDILIAALDEIHRYVERVVDIALKTHAVLE